VAPTDRPRPRTVSIAVAVLSAAALLQVGSYAALLFERSGLTWFPIAVTTVSLCAAAALLYALYAGHRWAQVVTLVSLGLGLPRTVYAVAAVQNWTDAAWVGLSLAISVGLGVLLLSRSARAWFRPAH
jgi:hypothetical protein